jgi:hypothetical protein
MKGPTRFVACVLGFSEAVVGTSRQTLVTKASSNRYTTAKLWKILS